MAPGKPGGFDYDRQKIYDSVLYSEDVQKTLDTYEDLIGSDEEQDESQGKAEEQEADNTAESRRKSL